jgi:phage baseplate assembly protein gpV
MSIKPGASAHVATSVSDNSVDSDAYVDGSIDADHLASDSVETAKIADNAVTLAKMAGLARGKFIYGDTSGDPAALAVGSANTLLGSDGTDISYVNVTSAMITDGTIVNADINASAAIALSKTALAAGTNISLSTNTLNVDDAFLVNDGNDTTSGIITAAGFTLSEAASVSIGTPLLPSTDHTYSGLSAQMLAGGTIGAQDLVCIHTTTSEVVVADASAVERRERLVLLQQLLATQPQGRSYSRDSSGMIAGTGRQAVFFIIQRQQVTLRRPRRQLTGRLFRSLA